MENPRDTGEKVTMCVIHKREQEAKSREFNGACRPRRRKYGENSNRKRGT